jgi:hypothetical protein
MKCNLCNDTKKVIIYPDGTISQYLPALASDSHHKGTTIATCPACKSSYVVPAVDVTTSQ